MARADLHGVRGDVREENGVWAIVTRDPLGGAGEWTQLYANAGHTAASDDSLAGDFAIQWFGDPGPRAMLDRHHRGMAPLVKNGRVFVAGDERVLALNEYNGTLLWELPIPDSRRVGALKSAGHMLVTNDALHVIVGDSLWALDVATGARHATFALPPDCGAGKEWGYLNSAGGVLLGTAQPRGAAFTELSRALIDTLEGDFRVVVVGDALFAVDRLTGAPLWTRRAGALMPSAITSDGARVFFVECRNDAARACKDGRLRVDAFLARDAFLVAADVATGAVAWERPVALPFQHIMYACAAGGLVLVSGSYNLGPTVWYGLCAFDAATGADKWRTQFRAMDVRGRNYSDTGGSHGEQWQHPVIIGERVYLRPYSFELATGVKTSFTAYRGGHGCGGLTGSQFFLFGRGDVPRRYPLDRGETDGIPLTLVSRPGCWLNIIPAGGLVVIPESSSGCTCPYSIQTSLALVPRDAEK
jgi:outer membrane protein assembly factor BamB